MASIPNPPIGSAAVAPRRGVFCGVPATVDASSTYLSVVIVAVLAAVVTLAVLLITGKLGPKRVTNAKYEVYECGIIPKVDARRRFSAKFYLVAILFVLFDIEVAFLVPWAVVFRELPGFDALIQMTVFLAVLVAGFIYVVRKGALQWE